ncbi:ABC transporter substrate-binding protein [Dactylosporangium sp. NPDC048998]|uniref:ABC transporter substrate-binding protein n=1 Tax=Dactylosporangium sp. NPDC048998 TaxID=3363976 RepID=UPI003713D074
MKRTMRALLVAATTGSLLLSAACSSGTDDASSSSGGKVELTFWSWVPGIDKVVAQWNAAHPDIHVTVSKQAQGDEEVTKVLTANKAGNPPDLFQAEYQALPTLVSNGAAGDISKYTGDAKPKFAPGVWSTITLGTDAVYAIPQDSGPMMLYYRQDVFAQLGLKVPTTWDEFAQVAKQVRQKDPKRYLTTFSAGDPGWFAGLSQQAGAKWFGVSGDTWSVQVDDAATKKVADYWGGLVASGDIDKQPMYTPEWNKALNDGTLIAWPSAVWGPGVLSGNAPDTAGKWAIAELPQWSAGEHKTGSWGGSSTAVAAKSKHAKEATEFAIWLNTDTAAVTGLINEGGIYPAATAAQSGGALSKPPAFFSNQPEFYTLAQTIAGTAAGVTWGPNVNVTYATYKDAFAKAITDKTPFTGAVTQMQQSTVDDLKKNGFKVAG